MNKEGLLQALRKEAIRDDAFIFMVAILQKRIPCPNRTDAGLYITVRKGLESGKKEFATESQACEYLLGLLKNDPTARM